jgi:predicted permease
VIRLLRLFRRGRLEDQLDKELHFHLDQHVAELIAIGHTPEQARRVAMLALGGRQPVKEAMRDVRGTRWLDDGLQDTRYAWRTLRQRPGFAVVALCTLALGIGAATVMFTVLDGVLLKPLPYRDPERLIAVWAHTEKYGDGWAHSYPNFLDARREVRALAPIAAWTYGGGTISQPGDAEYVNGRQISSSLFTVFGVTLSEGRSFLPEEDRPGGAPVVIIGHELRQRRFGGQPTAIGLPLLLDGKPYTVVGVVPDGFQLDGDGSVFTPLGQNPERRMQNRMASFIHVVARVRDGVTPVQAQAELSIVSQRLTAEYPEANAGRSFLLQPFSQELVGDVRSTLWLLLGAVSLVLLIAVVNVASLLLARAVSREREVAMRAALGASRGRLVRQCLTESAMLGLFGGALGVLLASVAIRPFVLLWPGNLPRAAEIQLDWRVLLFAVGASLFSSLLFGLAPALRAPARRLEQELRGGGRTTAGTARRLHSGFVMSEIALAVVLLVAAGVLARTMLRLSSSDPGVSIDHVLTSHVALAPGVLQNPAQMRAAWRDVLDRAGQVPGVQSVALSDVIPMRVGQNFLGYWTSPAPPPPNQMPLALASSVTPDYLTVMGIPLRQGRFFDAHDRLDVEQTVVIDEVLAQHAFPRQEAVGKRLWVQGTGQAPLRVVGVVGHVRHWGLADDDRAQIRDQIYYPFAQVPDPLMRLFSSFMSMTVRTSVPPSNVIEPLRRALRAAAGDHTLYEVRTMEQLASRSLGRQRFLMVLFGIFAAAALLLACIGIYGVLAYVTSQRVPEFGVRMALGATAHDVMRLVLGQSLKMILAGAGAGLAVAFAVARFIERLVAGVRSTEPLTFAVMIAVLVSAGLLASAIPARRASRIEPMRALRQE